ncbi:hypothetical protein DFH27DRAFT_310184 [Peziza echinospora]|nr:hypothetical protein DFH27DRAFT_310184 [Peziza echinospora]
MILPVAETRPMVPRLHTPPNTALPPTPPDSAARQTPATPAPPLPSPATPAPPLWPPLLAPPHAILPQPLRLCDPEAFAEWKLRNNLHTDQDRLPYEYNALTGDFAVKCMPSAYHDAVSLFIDPTVSQELIALLLQTAQAVPMRPATPTRHGHTSLSASSCAAGPTSRALTSPASRPRAARSRTLRCACRCMPASPRWWPRSGWRKRGTTLWRMQRSPCWPRAGSRAWCLP